MKGPVLSIFTCLFLLLFLAGCRQRFQKLSISQDELVPLLCDVHLSEAALQNVNGALKDSLTVVYLDQICKIHKISRERLDEVLAELRNNPDAMKKAYLEVSQKLQQRGNPQ